MAFILRVSINSGLTLFSGKYYNCQICYGMLKDYFDNIGTTFFNISPESSFQFGPSHSSLSL